MNLLANTASNDTTEKINEDRKKTNTLNVIIDTFSDDVLNLLQKDILKRIVYFEITKGEYIHLPKTLEKHYSEIAIANDIAFAILMLSLNGWITETIKKKIHNGRYVTQKYYKVNYEKIYVVK